MAFDKYIATNKPSQQKIASSRANYDNETRGLSGEWAVIDITDNDTQPLISLITGAGEPESAIHRSIFIDEYHSKTDWDNSGKIRSRYEVFKPLYCGDPNCAYCMTHRNELINEQRRIHQGLQKVATVAALVDNDNSTEAPTGPKKYIPAFRQIRNHVVNAGSDF
jgi:hypothetical protein